MNRKMRFQLHTLFLFLVGYFMGIVRELAIQGRSPGWFTSVFLITVFVIGIWIMDSSGRMADG